jgi:hypothetical protein
MLVSCALFLATINQTVPPNADIASGVALIRFFNTVESREKSSGGYKTIGELETSAAVNALAEQPADSDSPMRPLNRHDLSHPIPRWTITLYTSPDRLHYLIRAESADGVTVFSDERGMIQTGSPLR